MVEISIVIPVLNEETLIKQMTEEVLSITKSISENFEIIVNPVK